MCAIRAYAGLCIAVKTVVYRHLRQGPLAACLPSFVLPGGGSAPILDAVNFRQGSGSSQEAQVDMAALQSEFKRRLPTGHRRSARLIDCGFVHMDELRGRSPAAIMESVPTEARTPDDRLWSYRMLVYAAETRTRPALLHPHERMTNL
jgi:hypothetical protein